MLEKLIRLFGNQQAPSIPPKKFRVIGIDLGTTNSTLAEWVLDPQHPSDSSVRCIPIDQPTLQGRYSHLLVPSIVGIFEGKTWVGQGAKLLRSKATLEEYSSLFAECKNEMGTKRTYHRAPVGYRSAKAIASWVLRFLNDAAREFDDTPIEKTVVTVPASFQAAQRSDTVDAAQRAGIELSQNGLLDEPLAAFLTYVCEDPSDLSRSLLAKCSARAQNVVVFDFGGGTCDVAILRLTIDPENELAIMPLAVSRYHRLGGGDIDRAIVHEVLLTQLLEQNKLDRFSLSFEEKRQKVQPALLAVAEALKQNMCMEIDRLERMGRWETTKKSEIVQKIPGMHPVALEKGLASLHNPQLSAAQFEEILRPFLSSDLLYPREDEYHMTCSIFAPLSDALLRANVEPSQVDVCLLAGGSTLIPQIRRAVSQYFPAAEVLKFATRDDTQTAIAKGAAIHAMGLTLFGRSPIRSICHDAICLRTSSGLVELIPRGKALPFPTVDSARLGGFCVPVTDDHGRAQIRIEVVAGNEQRPLFAEIWEVPAPVRQGEPLWLAYRYDENQVLHLTMGRDAQGDQGLFATHIENPLTHVVNPDATRTKIDEIEEQLRTGQFVREEVGEKLAEVAGLYRQLNQNEKAIAYFSRAIQANGEPSAWILNRMASCANDIGDRQRSEQLYAEAARVDPWSGTYFNWALAKEAWGEALPALELVRRSIEMEFDPAYLVLQGRLEQKLGDDAAGQFLFERARETFPPPASLDAFGLSWLRTLAGILNDSELTRQVTELLAQRKREATRKVIRGGSLPDLGDGLYGENK